MQRVAWLGILLLGIGACQSRPPGPTVRVTAAPSYDPAQIHAVALLGTAHGIADMDAVRIFDPILEDHLMATPHPFVILPAREVERRAAAQGIRDTWREAQDYWCDRHRVDKFQLQALCEALGVDGVLAAALEDWRQSEPLPGSGEAPTTTIAASLSLYPMATARRVWKVEVSETQSAESAEDYDDARERTAVGRERTRAEAQRLPGQGAGAPRYEVVAQAVAAALATALAP